MAMETGFGKGHKFPHKRKRMVRVLKKTGRGKYECRRLRYKDWKAGKRA